MDAGEFRKKADESRDEDPMKAAELYEQAAALGDSASCSSLGYMLMTGEGIPKNEEKAVAMLSKASEMGDPKAMCNLGNLVLEKDPSHALELFEKAGRMGNITGMRNAAVMYRTGAGIPLDAQKAVEWLSLASETDVASMATLAHILRTGEGVPSDKPRAADLYRRAAEAGDPDSQYDLAMMLDSGDGIPMNRAEAERWFRESALGGDNDARLCLGGILYERGDYVGAEEMFTEAALDRDVKAMYNLALIYMGGELGERDMVKAEEWLESASDAGFAYAQTMLGTMALERNDMGKAEDLFRKAAAQNEPTAMYNLGALALSGKLKMDDKEAMDLLVKAAGSGMPEAQELIRRLTSTGRSPVEQLLQRGQTVRAIQRTGDTVPTIHYGAIHTERGGRHGIVGAVPHVQCPLLRNVEV